jgi:hypothetical protein
MAEPNVTLTITLSTDEAIDLAVLLGRLNLAQLRSLSWRAQGDTEATLAHWGAIVLRMQDELTRLGYPEVRQ